MIDYAGGVRGIVDVRWHSKLKRDECRIRGTEGEMELSPLNGPELIYSGGCENLPPHANLHSPLIENFVDAVLGKTPLAASGASSFWTDWVIERARRKTAKRTHPPSPFPLPPPPPHPNTTYREFISLRSPHHHDPPPPPPPPALHHTPSASPHPPTCSHPDSSRPLATSTRRPSSLLPFPLSPPILSAALPPPTLLSSCVARLSPA